MDGAIIALKGSFWCCLPHTGSCLPNRVTALQCLGQQGTALWTVQNGGQCSLFCNGTARRVTVLQKIACDTKTGLVTGGLTEATLASVVLETAKSPEFKDMVIFFTTDKKVIDTALKNICKKS